MTDVVALAKLALTQVGGQRIVDLAEDSSEAIAINDALPFVRRAELEANDWGFARARAELSAEVAAPIFGFTKSYVIPANCLRVRVVHGAGATWYMDSMSLEAEPRTPFQIEERRILTDLDAPLRIEYTFDEEVVPNWTANFQMMMGVRLAEIIAYDLSGTVSLADRLTRRYYDALQRAVLANECQMLPRRQPESEWVIARGGHRAVPLATST